MCQGTAATDDKLCFDMCNASQAAKHNRVQCFKHYISENRTVLNMLAYHHRLEPTKVIYMHNRNDLAAREDTKWLILAFHRRNNTSQDKCQNCVNTTLKMS
jgi:hypothetical protein